VSAGRRTHLKDAFRRGEVSIGRSSIGEIAFRPRRSIRPAQRKGRGRGDGIAWAEALRGRGGGREDAALVGAKGLLKAETAYAGTSRQTSAIHLWEDSFQGAVEVTTWGETKTQR